MSCPNCTCSSCEAERQRWLRAPSGPVPYNPWPIPSAPFLEYTLCLLCNMWYPTGSAHTCPTFTQPTPNWGGPL